MIKQCLLYLLFFNAMLIVSSFAQIPVHQNYAAKHLSPNVQMVVDRIVQNDCLEYPVIGLDNRFSEQYEHYLVLRNQAQTKELRHLLNHRNPVVRGYASWALADRQYNNLAEILVHHFKDTTNICVWELDVTENERLACAFYYYLWKHRNNGNKDKKTRQYINAQLAAMDRAILDNFYDIQTLTLTALTNRKPAPKDYEKVRQMAIQERLPQALIALARYQYPQDIEVIKSFGESAFLAIAQFPHPDFWDFLMTFQPKLLDNTLQYPSAYYEAIAAFKTNEALSFFKNLPKKITTPELQQMHLIRIFWALQSHKKSLYDDLLLQWWEAYKIINRTTFEYLKKRYKKQFHEHLFKGLINTNYPLKILTFNQEINETQWVLEKMLDLIHKKKPSKKVTVVNKNLKNTTSDILSFFIHQAQILQSDDFIPTLVGRLDDPTISNYNFQLIVETILEFNNPVHDFLLRSVLTEHARLLQDESLRLRIELLLRNHIRTGQKVTR